MIEQMTTGLIIGLCLVFLTGCNPANIIPNEASFTIYHEDRRDQIRGIDGYRTDGKSNGISGTATWYIR